VRAPPLLGSGRWSVEGRRIVVECASRHSILPENKRKCQIKRLSARQFDPTRKAPARWVRPFRSSPAIPACSSNSVAGSSNPAVSPPTRSPVIPISQFTIPTLPTLLGCAGGQAADDGGRRRLDAKGNPARPQPGRACQTVLATSWDAIQHKTRGLEMRVVDAASNSCCSPRPRMSSDSRREGWKCVSLTRRATSALPSATVEKFLGMPKDGDLDVLKRSVHAAIAAGGAGRASHISLCSPRHRHAF